MLSNNHGQRRGVGNDEGLIGVEGKGSFCQKFKNVFVLDRWKYPTSAEARTISWISIFFTLITGIVGMIVAIAGESAAMLAFSLEGLVDVLSSVVLLWRFNGRPEDDEFMESRESRASAAIGICFIILAFSVSIVAVVHLTLHQEPRDTSELLALTIPSGFVLLILGLLKLHISRTIKSKALYRDGVVTLVSCLQSAGVIFGIAMYRINASVWYFDSVFALFISAFLFVYGVYVVNQYHWTRRSFWSGAEEEERRSGSESIQVEEYGIDMKPIDMDMI
uniref:Cation efflux protein transmembrane domain-containing protein n=1 Tax=Mucochytrium quahogii TaxID=96639 RepID=A0A7S2SED6_9STRA|mmetsp:Transcript_20665/g.33653  ORF Transcript_20665/g.33653 Transcript_20665/m.33653 type:complete len:278 (+) Transcript_20665:188-1021(+)